MNDKNPNASTHLSARRRLVRGVFSAPAALTLYSGSVAARSVVNSVTRQVATPDLTPAVPTAAQGTTYVRVQLQKFYGKSGATTLTNRCSRWISGVDMAALQAAGSGNYLVSGSWQLYDRGTTNVATCGVTFNPASAYAGFAVGVIINSTPTEAGSVACSGGVTPVSVTNNQIGDQWVAIKVNSNGDIVGVVGINNAGGQSAVTQSVWTSFRLG